MNPNPEIMTDTHEHDHGCGCGCENEVYPPYLGIGTVGFVLVAISMVVGGISYILSFSHNGDITWDPSVRTLCLYVYAVTGGCLLVLAAYGVLTGVYAESFLFAVFATFTFAVYFVATNGTVSTDAMHLCDFVLAAFMFIPMIVFILNREGLLAIATFAYAFGLLLSEIITLTPQNRDYIFPTQLEHS